MIEGAYICTYGYILMCMHTYSPIKGYRLSGHELDICNPGVARRAANPVLATGAIATCGLGLGWSLGLRV